jgi:hypothetical protein
VRRSKRGVKVPFTKQQIKDGPAFDADRHLSAEQVSELAYYYGLIGAGAWPKVGLHDGGMSGQIPRQRAGAQPADSGIHAR